jgi:class 3 adenylate cyclase
MGLHSGEPIRHEDGYIGLDVHKAARCGPRRAGRALGGHPPADRFEAAGEVSLRDLGFHRLKDIEAPKRIYQLVARQTAPAAAGSKTALIGDRQQDPSVNVQAC